METHRPTTYSRETLQAQGDTDASERLLADREVQRAIERFEKDADKLGARRQLLGTAMRLSPEMAPDIAATMDACRSVLGIELPVETYVYPSPQFNAAAIRPERGLLLVMLSSSLLEAFESDELKFVIGHELGHHLFDHHRIPGGALLGGEVQIGAALALQLFAWQRYAEISSDRAGLACAGRLEPAAHALFKLSTPNKVRALIGSFALSNALQFNRPDGAGYAFLAEKVLEIDRLNPQIASRLLSAFRSFRGLEPKRRGLAAAALAKVAEPSDISRDIREIVTRMLED